MIDLSHLEDVMRRSARPHDHITQGAPEDIVAVLRSVPYPSSVIELGCGAGPVLKLVHSVLPQSYLVGVDLYPSKELPAGEYRQADFHDLPMFDRVFDCAIAVVSLRMSYNPERAVQEMCRVTKQSCIVVEYFKGDNADMSMAEWVEEFRHNSFELVDSRPTDPDGHYILVFRRNDD